MEQGLKQKHPRSGKTDSQKHPKAPAANLLRLVIPLDVFFAWVVAQDPSFQEATRLTRLMPWSIVGDCSVEEEISSNTARKE